jgi:hypothetical protein
MSEMEYLAALDALEAKQELLVSRSSQLAIQSRDITHMAPKSPPALPTTVSTSVFSSRPRG